MRTKALLLTLGLLVPWIDGQYQSNQFQNGGQQGFQQSGGSFQQSGGFQSGGGFQSSGGNGQRYQQAHVVVGPGPVIGGSAGGQFQERRTINIQENVQGTLQGGGYGGGSYQYGQQYGRFNQAGFGQGMQAGNNGRTVISNNPMVFDSTNGGLKGSQIDIRLTSYTNTGLRLPNSTTCNCPISNCNFVPPNQQNQCQFSFLIVISSADQSVQFTQSNFWPAATNGIMTTGNWTNQHTFYMNTKPVALDVFVQHLGVVIDTTGTLLFFNHLTLVDSFVVDLSKFDGSPNNQGGQTLTMTGQILQTQLQMNLNVQCINNFMGPLCDMNCNSTNAQANQNVLCLSNRTGVWSVCTWNQYRTQVINCNTCSQGTHNGTCAAGAIFSSYGVAYAFRTWTIVLGCLLGIALLLILCLILSYLIILNRSNEKVINREEMYEEKQVVENSNGNGKAYKKRDSDNKDYPPLIRKEEFTSHTGTIKPVPVSILSKRNEGQRPSVDYQQQQIQQQQQQYQRQQQQLQQNSEPVGRKQQDTPDTEESYLANGNVQQTTTTTTTTTRREQIV